MAYQVEVKPKEVQILLVEDNLGDVVLMKEMIKYSRFPIRLNVARNGLDALHYLRRQEPYPNAGEPDLILLDLNLPKMGGRDLLGAIKSDRELCEIPVLIMTSSKDPKDLEQSYANNANFFIVKPMDMGDYLGIMKYIEDFWLEKLWGHSGGKP